MTEFKKREAEYWQECFEAVEQNSVSYGKTAYIEIEKAFALAEKDIQKEIDAWYTRLAKNNGITLSEAKKLLGGKELKEFQWDIAEYIKYDKENAINGQWVKQLENTSAKVHISQLEALKIRTQQSLEAAFKTEFDEVRKMGLDVVEDSCYRTAFEIQKGCGVGWQIGEIDKEKINNIISKPWTTDGKTFSDRIWSRKQQMISDLQQELTRSCIYGRPFEETVKLMEQYVSSNVKKAKYAAERLVRTENASFSSMGQKEGLEKIGIKWYKIYVTIDSKTCPICREMNGKKFRMSDFQIGITAPPFHPNCDKSSIGPTTPDNKEDEDELDRIRREVREEIKKTNTLSEKERFEEWKKKFVYGDKSEPEVVDKSENGGIINEKSKKPITPITDKAIDSVPNVQISGYTAEQCDYIQQQHKELLKYAREENGCNEVAFVFRKDLSDRTAFTGSDDKLDFGSGLLGKGDELFIMHNHPRNSGYSANDLIEFFENDSLKALSIVKNNGKVEVITKINQVDKKKGIVEILRIKKNIKTESEKEYCKEIDKLLKKYSEKGLIEWIT